MEDAELLDSFPLFSDNGMSVSNADADAPRPNQQQHPATVPPDPPENQEEAPNANKWKLKVQELVGSIMNGNNNTFLQTEFASAVSQQIKSLQGECNKRDLSDENGNHSNKRQRVEHTLDDTFINGLLAATATADAQQQQTNAGQDPSNEVQQQKDALLAWFSDKMFQVESSMQNLFDELSEAHQAQLEKLKRQQQADDVRNNIQQDEIDTGRLKQRDNEYQSTQQEIDEALQQEDFFRLAPLTMETRAKYEKVKEAMQDELLLMRCRHLNERSADRSEIVELKGRCKTLTDQVVVNAQVSAQNTELVQQQRDYNPYATEFVKLQVAHSDLKKEYARQTIEAEALRAQVKKEYDQQKSQTEALRVQVRQLSARRDNEHIMDINAYSDLKRAYAQQKIETEALRAQVRQLGINEQMDSNSYSDLKRAYGQQKIETADLRAKVRQLSAKNDMEQMANIPVADRRMIKLQSSFIDLQKENAQQKIEIKALQKKAEIASLTGGHGNPQAEMELAQLKKVCQQQQRQLQHLRQQPPQDNSERLLRQAEAWKKAHEKQIGELDTLKQLNVEACREKRTLKQQILSLQQLLQQVNTNNATALQTRMGLSGQATNLNTGSQTISGAQSLLPVAERDEVLKKLKQDHRQELRKVLNDHRGQTKGQRLRSENLAIKIKELTALNRDKSETMHDMALEVNTLKAQNEALQLTITKLRRGASGTS